MSLGDVLWMEEQQCCPFYFCLLNSHMCRARDWKWTMLVACVT